MVHHHSGRTREAPATRTTNLPRTARSWALDVLAAVTIIAGLGLTTVLTNH